MEGLPGTSTPDGSLRRPESPEACKGEEASPLPPAREGPVPAAEQQGGLTHRRGGARRRGRRRGGEEEAQEREEPQYFI